MKNFYFTFGSAHKDKNGNSLVNAYVKILAKNYGKARDIMWEVRDKWWAFQYEEKEFLPQIDRFNLHEVGITEI